MREYLHRKSGQRRLGVGVQDGDDDARWRRSPEAQRQHTTCSFVDNGGGGAAGSAQGIGLEGVAAMVASLLNPQSAINSPVDDCAASPQTRHPVILATGEKILVQSDFSTYLKLISV
jgi:hypothetical protein